MAQVMNSEFVWFQDVGINNFFLSDSASRLRLSTFSTTASSAYRRFICRRGRISLVVLCVS